MKREPSAELNKHFRFAGPCGICGGPDSRHRLWDAMISRYDAGESIEEVAADYGVSVEAVALLVKERPYAAMSWKQFKEHSLNQ